MSILIWGDLALFIVAAAYLAAHPFSTAHLVVAPVIVAVGLVLWIKRPCRVRGTAWLGAARHTCRAIPSCSMLRLISSSCEKLLHAQRRGMSRLV